MEKGTVTPSGKAPAWKGESEAGEPGAERQGEEARRRGYGTSSSLLAASRALGLRSRRHPKRASSGFDFRVRRCQLGVVLEEVVLGIGVTVRV